MAGSSTTYTINFEANLSNLQKLQGELTKIKNNANIKLDVGGKKSLELLEGQLNSVIKAIQAKMQDGKMASGDILGLKSQFADLLKLTDNFKASLLDLSVSPDAIEQIKKLSEQLTIAQEQLKVLRAHRKDAAAGFKVTDGKVERPLLQTKNQAFADVKGSMSLTAPNSDKVITSYQQLENVITKLRAELGEDISKWTGEAANLGQIWNEINAELDKRVAEAQQKLDDATAAVQQKREEITNIKADLKAAQDAAIDTSDLTDEMRDQLRAVQDVSTAMDVDYKTTLQEVRTEQKKATTATNQGTDSTKKATTTFGRAIQNVVSYGTAIQLVRRIYQNFIRTITDLDKALTNMTVVTTLTRDQAWELTGTLQSLAKQTGMTSTEIANMTTMYLQQGKTLEDALTLTEAAAKAARIAGISGEESINLLTNAMNGFQLAASEAMEVSDKFAALAASAATNYEELATALSKVAAQANLAGLSMDFTLGLLTKGIETTREAPETIGTALKTVLSRMRELTDYGKTLEDGLDVNRVEKALTNVGIALRDSNGQFRDMESVLTEVGMKWDQLNTNQQANIAVALAGTRQQSRLIAMMQGFDRTLELTNIALTSQGATAAQHRKYMQGLEAATSRLTTSYQEFVTALTNSDVAITVINKLSDVLSILSNNIAVVYGLMGGILVLFAPLIAQKLLDIAATAGAAIVELLHAKAINKAVEAEGKQVAATGLSIKARIADILATKLQKKGLDAETASTIAAKAAQDALNESMLTNPITAVLIVVMALIAAWWSLNKETDRAKNLLEALKTIFTEIIRPIGALFDALKPIFDIVMILVDYAMVNLIASLQIVAMILKAISIVVTFLVKAIGWVVDFLFQWLGPVGDFFGNLWDTITNGLNWVLDKMEGAFKGMEYLFADASERIGMLAEEIAANEEKIYENQQYANQLQPLIDEYEQLNALTNKSADDLARMEEIRSQVHDIDETLDLSLGTDAAQAEVDKKVEEANKLIEENYEKAQKGLQEAAKGSAKKAGKDKDEAQETWNNTPEMKRAVAAHIQQQVNANTELTEAQRRNINAQVENIVGSKTFEKGTDLDAFSDQLAGALTELYTFESDNVEETIKHYSDVISKYSGVADDLKNQFSDFENVLALNLNDKGYDAVSTLGLTPEEITKLKNAFVEAGGTEDDFNSQLQQILNSGGSVEDLANHFMQLGNDLPTDKVQAFKNKLLELGGQDVQSTLENLTRATSWSANVADAAQKFASGELTEEDLRALSVDNPDLFKDDAFLAAFQSGDLSTWQREQDRKAKDEAETEIKLRNAQLQADAARLAAKGNLTAEEQALLDDYNAQIKTNDIILDQMEHRALWANEVYQAAKALTEEEKKQAAAQAKINRLQNMIGNSETPNRALYQQLLNSYNDDIAANKAKYDKTFGGQNVLDMYETLADGTLQLSAKALADAYDNNYELYKYVTENDEAIKDAYTANFEYEQTILDTLNEIQDAAVEAAKEQLELEKEQIEKRKELYQEYWDSLDALDEEQDRTNQRDSLLSQLQALTGGADAATKAKRKELMQSLQDLSDEEMEAQKQAMRDAALKDMDDAVASIDEKLDSLENLSKIVNVGTSIESILGAVASQSGIPVADLMSNEVPTGWDSGVNSTTKGMVKNKRGGLINFTGPTWVDGTISNPEAFLSAADTKLMRALLDALHAEVTGLDRNIIDEASNFIIESINIHTDHLDNSQDFGRAGQTLAEEFAKAIQRRGININVKK